MLNNLYYLEYDLKQAQENTYTANDEYYPESKPRR